VRPLRQPAGQGFGVLQRDQAGAQLIRFRRGLLARRCIGRQQQSRAQLHQPGRHHHPVGFLAQRHRRRRLAQRGGQLVEHR
jgi:hypothetical protein